MRTRLFTGEPAPRRRLHPTVRAAAGRPRWPGRSLAGAALAAVAASAIALAPPPAVASDPEAGLRKAGQCKVCHGIDGIGRNPEVPNIAGESIIYLISQLRAFRSGKRQHHQMSVIAAGLTDEDIADLAAYYSLIEVSATVPAFAD